jgi:tetratricopeptide (TPR) repeat protein
MRNSPGSTFSEFLLKRGVMEVLLCALTALAYVGTLAFGFVYDDEPAIVRDSAVHAWRYVPFYFFPKAFAGPAAKLTSGFYRPINLLWLRINHAVFGLNPAWWHLAALAGHLLVTYLVFAVGCKLLGDRKTAFVAGILFGLHPVHVENVAWLAAINDTLICALLLMSFLAFLRYFSGRRKLWLVASFGLFALALLTKETAGMFPFLIFAYAALFGARARGPNPSPGTAVSHPIPQGGTKPGLPGSPASEGVRESAAYFAIGVAYLAVRWLVLPAAAPGSASLPIRWTTMILTWPSVLWFDFRHLALPLHSSEFYSLAYVTAFSFKHFAWPLLLVLACVLVTALLIRRSRHSRAGWFALLWVVLLLVPSLYLRAIAFGDFVHDRFLYLPSVGFVFLVSLALAELPPRIVGQAGEGARWVTVALLAGISFAGTVHHQLPWGSDLLLFEQGLKCAPGNNNVRDNLANALASAGKYDRAIPLYLEVLRRDPRFWRSAYNLGYAYYRTGNFREAEYYLDRAIQIDRGDADQFLYLALAQLRQGKLAEARQNAGLAIAKAPSASGYHFVLGAILAASGERDPAIAEFQAELANHPENTQAREELQRLGR